MELTKEQQKIINRYKIMPSFLQERNLTSVLYRLQVNGISREVATQLIFQSSSSNIKNKHFDTFIRDTWNSNDSFQEIMSFFKNLPVKQQDKILKNASDFTLIFSLGDAAPELQEKYFNRFLENDLSQYHIGDLNKEREKIEICDNMLPNLLPTWKHTEKILKYQNRNLQLVLILAQK